MFTAILDFVSSLVSQIFVGGYLSGNYTFPKPLSAEEEKKYLSLLRDGDESARNTLVEHNLRLVAHIVKKYAPTYNKDTDDLISIGTIGLIKAINSFDGSKGIRLATYAARCIQNEILMVMRSGKKEQKEVSLQDPIGVDKEGHSISLLGIMYSDDEDVADMVSLKMQVVKLYEAMTAHLKDREKEVIQMRYGLCGNSAKTQREIADMMGISRSYVSRIETKALKKLSAALALEEY